MWKNIGFHVCIDIHLERCIEMYLYPYLCISLCLHLYLKSKSYDNIHIYRKNIYITVYMYTIHHK